MTVNMLMFEVNETEELFFKTNSFEGFNISFFDECLNDEFVDCIPDKLLQDTTVISISKDSSLTDSVLDRFKNLRIISIRCDDFDQVCISRCKERNIAVINISENNTKSAAQFVIGLIINLVRNIVPATRITRVTKEFNDGFIGRDLSELTLGIIGTNRIGFEICRIANSMDMKIVAFDKFPKREFIHKFNINYMPIFELAKVADIICVNLDYYPENYHFFNNDFFDKCKDDLYFVSISRSELIDYKALYDYIDKGKFKGVALDTTPCDSICYHCKNLSNKLIVSNLNCLEQTNYIEKIKNYENVLITPCLSRITKDSSNYILKQTMHIIMETIAGDRIYRVV